MCLGKGFSGTVEYDPFYGDPRITVFDPLTEKFNQLHSMAHGRWYATAITLSDGRILAFSGLNETGQTNSAVEMYTVASGWSSPYAAPFVPPQHPWLHLLPNGNVFDSGSSSPPNIFNPSNHTWTLKCRENLPRLKSHLREFRSVASASDNQSGNELCLAPDDPGRW